MKELFERFIADYSEPRNKLSMVEANRGYGKLYIIPHPGQIKAADVTRAYISSLMKKMAKTPPSANRVLSAVRKMFNMAEVWGMRPDGSNPCRQVPKFPERGKTRLITDAELKRLYAYLNKAEAEGLEHPRSSSSPSGYSSSLPHGCRRSSGSNGPGLISTTLYRVARQ